MSSIFPMILIRRGGLPLACWNDLSVGDSGREMLEEKLAALSEQLRGAFDEALQLLPESPLRTRVYNARKAFFQRGKLPTEAESVEFNRSEVLQGLSLLLQEYQRLREALAGTEQEWEKSLLQQYEALQKIAQRDDFQRMLLMASHDLLEARPAFLSKSPQQFGKKERQIALSILQYLSRAIFKTSPLGRFTTVQVRTFETLNQESEFPEIERSQVVPNVALLPLFYEVLLQDKGFYSALDLRLNPGLSSDEGRLQWLYFDGEREAFQETAPDALMQWMVGALLEKEGGQISFTELIAGLSANVDAAESALRDFVFRLVDIGLLEWVWPEPGMSASWCGNLLQFLARLPQTPLLTEAAFLLQWLRTAARTLPFQPNEAIKATQEEALERCRTFVESQAGVFPPIPAEQIFFEDMQRDIPLRLPSSEIQRSIIHLRALWQQHALTRLPLFRQKLWRYTQRNVPAAGMPFMAFCRDFLQKYPRIRPLKKQAVDQRTAAYRKDQKIGALLQFFVENGEYKAVVNALYPGSGKLFARWSAFFPVDMIQSFRDFFGGHSPALELDFPWQSWTNANFQPETPKTALLAPGGRLPISKGKKKIRMSDLLVKADAAGMPVLVSGDSNQQVVISDLGLEAPEGRPPAMQVLWHLGVPWVSLNAVMPESAVWEDRQGVSYRKRVEYESLVLARESWVLNQEQCRNLFEGSTPGEKAAAAIRKLKGWGIPVRFFAQITGGRQKPQFFDMNSPISMVLLEKTLRNATKPLWITEMLPLPEQWVEEYSSEITVE